MKYLIVAIMAFTLVGCGNDNEGDNEGVRQREAQRQRSDDLDRSMDRMNDAFEKMGIDTDE